MTDLSIARPRRLRARSAPISQHFDQLELRTLAAASITAAAHWPSRTHHAARVQAETSPGTVPTYGVRALPNLVYTNHGGPQHLDLYLPAGKAPPGGWPTVLALPGGGWRWVRRSDLGVTVSQLATYGYAVAVADYAYASSQIGTHIWPTDFADVQDAVRWLRQNASHFGLDTNRIAAWGESAGGNLATLLGTYPDTPATSGPPSANPPGFSDGVSAKVQAVIDFYGPTDMTALYNEDSHDRSYVQTFLGGTPDQVPGAYQAASPINYVAPGDPPMLLFQGTADQASPVDIAERFIAALQAAGVPNHAEILPGVSHGFRLRLDHGQVNFLPEVLTFLDEALNHQGQGVSSLSQP